MFAASGKWEYIVFEFLCPLRSTFLFQFKLKTKAALILYDISQYNQICCEYTLIWGIWSQNFAATRRKI
jgi:hypothetical protein